MRSAHGFWAVVTVAVAGGVGIWTVIVASLGAKATRGLRNAGRVALGVIFVQVLLGLLTYQRGFRPRSDMHLVIGYVILGTVVASVLLQGWLRRRPALSGALLVALAALGIVGMQFVGP